MAEEERADILERLQKLERRLVKECRPIAANVVGEGVAEIERLRALAKAEAPHGTPQATPE